MSSGWMVDKVKGGIEGILKVDGCFGGIGVGVGGVGRGGREVSEVGFAWHWIVGGCLVLGVGRGREGEITGGVNWVWVKGGWW